MQGDKDHLTKSKCLLTIIGIFMEDLRSELRERSQGSAIKDFDRNYRKFREEYCDDFPS